nr:ribonuclease HII [bacterium]
MKRDEAALQRLETLLEEEEALGGQGILVAGVDEAGRGPLAGPVCAACCVLDAARARKLLTGLDDSKKLTERRREALFDPILEVSVCHGIGFATVEEIGRLNILGATFLAMKRAISLCHPAPGMVWVDGNQPIPGLDYPQRTVVGGDGKRLCIAAASVLAKVSRDRYMRKLDERYPGYGFASHKGYGSAAHIQAIRALGPCPEHRALFLRNIYPS